MRKIGGRRYTFCTLQSLKSKHLQVMQDVNYMKPVVFCDLHALRHSHERGIMRGRESPKAEPATPAEPVNRAFFIAKEAVDDGAGFGSRFMQQSVLLQCNCLRSR